MSNPAFSQQAVAALKRDQEEKVKSRGLDRDVRDAAKLGQFDGTANYEHVALVQRPGLTGQWALNIRCTQGAGTNTASVSYIDQAPSSYTHALEEFLRRGVTVYAADDYGRNLRTFRDGWWSPIVQAFGQSYRDTAGAQALVREMQDIAKQARQFTPLED